MTLLPIREGGVTVTADYCSFFHLSQSMASLPNMLRYNDLVKVQKGPIPVLDFISNAEIDGQREAGWRAGGRGANPSRNEGGGAGDAIAACPSGFIIISSEDKATHKKSSSGGTLNKISAAMRTRRILIFQVPKVPIY